MIQLYGFTRDLNTLNYMTIMKYSNLRNDLLNISKDRWIKKLFQLYNIISDLNELHQQNLNQDNSYSGNISDFRKNISNIDDIGLSSDIYSYSMFMWEIISGITPFNNIVYNNQLVLSICKGKRPNINDNIPQCYERLMKKCWDINSLKRPTALEIKNIIENWYKNILTKDFDKKFINEIIEFYKEDNIIKLKSNILPVSRIINNELISNVRLNLFSDTTKNLNKISNLNINEILNKEDFNETNEILDQLKLQQKLQYHPNIIQFYGITSIKIDPKSLNDQNYKLNKKSDVYSIGVLMWQISSGYRPIFNKDDIIQGKREEIIHDTPIEYKCWKCEPNERPNSKQIHSKNIVIHDGNAKITDFEYQYNKASDIYSFGVLMWEVSSGITPFKDDIDDPVVLSIAIAKGAREATIINTPKEYEILYQQCWDSEPEKRPTVKVILEKIKKMIIEDLLQTYLDANPERNPTIIELFEVSKTMGLPFEDLYQRHFESCPEKVEINVNSISENNKSISEMQTVELNKISDSDLYLENHADGSNQIRNINESEWELLKGESNYHSCIKPTWKV
ncbi:16552_t:CDS:2 [Funneliformis geosporum]|nr:16552_t:CDS:2 [Funneliformis geosporum]